MADAVEAFRQHVDQATANELGDVERHRGRTNPSKKGRFQLVLRPDRNTNLDSLSIRRLMLALQRHGTEFELRSPSLGGAKSPRSSTQTAHNWR